MQCHSGFTDGEQPIVLSMCGHSVETIRYCVSQEKVSIHLPVSRLLAGINLVKNISGNGKCYINIICFCVGIMNHRTAVESLKYLVNLSLTDRKDDISVTGNLPWSTKDTWLSLRGCDMDKRKAKLSCFTNFKQIQLSIECRVFLYSSLGNSCVAPE